MMNFPGVLSGDPEVMAKINAAISIGKPVDGHAPGLPGEDAKAYFSKGITTDHECFTYEEGLEKARLGVKILIREGSAARNFEALWPLLTEFPRQIMFCSDDKHPDDLLHGHINALVARAVAKGCDLFDVLRAACSHPVERYRMPVGLLREGDPADFILVDNLRDFSVRETWIDGVCVRATANACSQKRRLLLSTNSNAEPVQAHDFAVPVKNALASVRVIRALEGQIVTEAETARLQAVNGHAGSPTHLKTSSKSP
jgi:adenine deaminase